MIIKIGKAKDNDFIANDPHVSRTFCYKVMSFGLKNAGATYQRAMVALFHDMIHHEIEVYVDDMITMKLLGFIVSDKGIQVDPAKVKAIQEMPTPKTERSQRLPGTTELHCLIHLTSDCYL